MEERQSIFDGPDGRAAWVWFWMGYGLSFIDWLLTALLLKRLGYTEFNPITGLVIRSGGMGMLALVKAAVPLLVMLWVIMTKIPAARALFVLRTVALGLSLAVLWNGLLLVYG